MQSEGVKNEKTCPGNYHCYTIYYNNNKEELGNQQQQNNKSFCALFGLTRLHGTGHSKTLALQSGILFIFQVSEMTTRHTDQPGLDSYPIYLFPYILKNQLQLREAIFSSLKQAENSFRASKNLKIQINKTLKNNALVSTFGSL